MKPTAYIFDVDGTLANVDPYLHHVRGTNKDYDAFHKASIDALPNIDVLLMLNNAVSDRHTILVVTSRKEKWRGLTSMWLAINNARSHALFMRSDEDDRPDYEVKKDILDKINDYWTVVHAVDDNPNVIRLWEEHGITTTKIGTWDGNKH
jgi:phosphoglycolate phosphatase-like HAD superfamily hydrolase